MKTWPALEVRGLVHANVGADFSRPDVFVPELFQAALTDYDVAAIDDNNPGAWHVFFPTAEERERACTGLAPDFPELSFSPVDVPDDDWAARSQQDLHAVRVGDMVVAPPWDVPASGMVIVIQPSMGFGTGHHATTRLCLAALQRLELRGRSVIDVGTGSGVLAIAASRLGASPVVAIDDDPDAIQSARENVVTNAVTNVDVRTVDLRSAALQAFDVVVANLTGGLLIQAAPRLQDLAIRGGTLILSGFMTHEEADVLAAFGVSSKNDLRPHYETEEGWVCVTLRR